MVRLQSDRVGRRRPGPRDEDRTLGRDADERESTAQRGPCPSDQLHDSRVRATVDHHGVAALGDGHDLVPQHLGHGLELLLAHDAGTADQHDDRPVQTQPGAVERGRDLRSSLMISTVTGLLALPRRARAAVVWLREALSAPRVIPRPVHVGKYQLAVAHGVEQLPTDITL